MQPPHSPTKHIFYSPATCLSCNTLTAVTTRIVRYLLHHTVLADPALASAPIPEASFNTTNNVDRETAALLNTMTPQQQANYLAASAAAQQSAAAADAQPGASTTPSAGSGNATGGSGANGTAPQADNSTAAAAAELLAVFAALQAGIANGSMERSTGYQTLDLSATVM